MERRTMRPQDLHLPHTEDVHKYHYVNVQLQRHMYDYLDYLPRLVSTRKLVEDGSRGINN
jgi:hypothetical protein